MGDKLRKSLFDFNISFFLRTRNSFLLKI